jgi:hypothetical protein
LPLDAAGSSKVAHYAVKHIYQFTESRPAESANAYQKFLMETRDRMAARFRGGSMVLASAEVPVYEKRGPASAKAEPSETATPVDVDALPYETTTGANLQNDTLGKADKLEPAYKEESTLKKVVKSAGIVPTKNAADPLEGQTLRRCRRN